MIKVLIADDHPVVRHGLKRILAETPDLVMTGEAVNGLQVLESVRSKQWDVVVLDISLPDRSGLEILKDLKRIRPKLPVLVLSIHSEDQYALRCLKAGASGYMTKETAPDELVKAVRQVSMGGKYVSSYLAEQLAFDVVRGFERPLYRSLSNREYEVMCQIATGRTKTEISKELLLSAKTISTYRERILKKMKLRTNAELTYYAVKHGLLD